MHPSGQQGEGHERCRPRCTSQVGLEASLSGDDLRGFLLGEASLCDGLSHCCKECHVAVTGAGRVVTIKGMRVCMDDRIFHQHDGETSGSITLLTYHCSYNPFCQQLTGAMRSRYTILRPKPVRAAQSSMNC